MPSKQGWRGVQAYYYQNHFAFSLLLLFSLWSCCLTLMYFFFYPLWYHNSLRNGLIHSASAPRSQQPESADVRALLMQNLSLCRQVPPPWQQQVDQAQDGGAATHRQPAVEPHLHLLRPAARRPQQRLPGAHCVGQRGPGQQRLPRGGAARSRHRCVSSLMKGKASPGILNKVIRLYKLGTFGRTLHSLCLSFKTKSYLRRLELTISLTTVRLCHDGSLFSSPLSFFDSIVSKTKAVKVKLNRQHLGADSAHQDPWAIFPVVLHVFVSASSTFTQLVKCKFESSTTWIWKLCLEQIEVLSLQATQVRESNKYVGK